MKYADIIIKLFEIYDRIRISMRRKKIEDDYNDIRDGSADDWADSFGVRDETKKDDQSPT